MTDLRAYARGGGWGAGRGQSDYDTQSRQDPLAISSHLASDEIWIERSRRDASPADDKKEPPSKTAANTSPHLPLTKPVRELRVQDTETRKMFNDSSLLSPDPM